jgi:hypothetical protein
MSFAGANADGRSSCMVRPGAVRRSRPEPSHYTCASAPTDVRQCAYRTVDDVASDIVAGREDGWFFSAYDSDLIVLDELGEAKNDLHLKAIKKTLDIRERYWHRSGIYISNHEPRKLAGLYDASDRGRIGSRLLCGTIYHLDGPDRRQEFA